MLRKFVKDYSHWTVPLTELIIVGSEFEWAEKQDAAFRKLKEVLGNPLVMA